MLSLISEPMKGTMLRIILLILLLGQLGVPEQAQTQPQVAGNAKSAPARLPGTSTAMAPSDLASKKILILHSFAYAQPVYKIIDTALIDSFVSSGINFNNLYFEFLDLARNPGQEYRNELIELFRRKYKARKFDLVLTLHLDSLQFLLKEGQDVYPEGPIISLLGDHNFAGHSDSRRPLIYLPFSIDVVSTVKAIFALQPDTQKIVVIAGSPPMDRRFENIVRDELKAWKGALDVEYMPPLPLDEILKKVAHLPPKTAILYTNVAADSTGKTYLPRDVARMISQSANAPVFGLYETLLGDNGIVGGIILNHRVEGERAVRSAMEILRGQLPTKPFTILPAPLVPMYDWPQLTRWGFRESALPANAIILNKPISPWERYKGYIIATVAFFLAETVLIIFLIVQRKRKKVAEESLRQKTEELDQFFSVSLDPLCIANSEGYFMRLNPAWERVLGHTREELMAKQFLDFVHPDDLDSTREALSSLASQQKLFYFENRYRCKDGTYRWLQWNSAPAGKRIYAAARDITARKRAEEAIRESERILRRNENDLRNLAGRLINAQEEERSRLARELHDDLAQRLAVFAIDVARLEQQLADPPAPVREELREMKNNIVRISQDVHDLSRQLHPSILDDLGLIKAVESECMNFSKREGIEIVFNHENIPRVIPKEISLCLYRIIQEGLNNISKHACAEHISISLKGIEHEVLLSVQDDGIGFDSAEAQEEPGLGFSSMRERARLIHGELAIQSQPEKGTVITLRAPLTREGE
jgi:PAS domain S-box-containing protein